MRTHPRLMPMAIRDTVIVLLRIALGMASAIARGILPHADTLGPDMVPATPMRRAVRPVMHAAPELIAEDASAFQLRRVKCAVRFD